MEIILRWKTFNYMLEIDILRNNFPKKILRGVLCGFGCSKDTQMPCWLRLCFRLAAVIERSRHICRWISGSLMGESCPLSHGVFYGDIS